MTEALIPTWQVPQQFEPATSYQVRDELCGLVARDLLGPWDGESEEFGPNSTGPRDRYLVGMLGPRHVPGSVAADASEVPDVEVAAEGGGDAELPETLSAQSVGRIWASSMGLSFAVASDTTVVMVLVEWGQYTRAETETEDGRIRRVWVREQFSRSIEVRVDGAGASREWLVGERSDEYGVWLSTEVRDRGNRRVVRLTLANGQSEEVTPKDLAWLFQTRLTVTALDGVAGVFLPIADPLDGAAHTIDPEESHLELLYRDQLRHTTGHNVAVHADVPAGQRRAWRLSTTWLPTYEVPQVAPTSSLAGLQTSMDTLADLAEGLDPTALSAALTPLSTGYRDWLAEQENKLATLPEVLHETAKGAVHRAKEIAQRVNVGIALLGENASARRAFAFANRAMALQRRNTAAAAARADDPTLSYSEAYQSMLEQGPSAASWRPFQLAFVLLNLPSLTEPGHPERSQTVDLLFFPTGGGKTEAYLGLAAYTFAIRRLQKVVGTGADARDGTDGVAVLMRYTLRLLTAQQFQRAAALICAAEVLRREDPDTWGEERFRIGLWVGGSVSPNWYADAAAQIAEAREAGNRARANVLQTLSCAWCGAPLHAHRDLRTDDARRRVILYCPEGEGSQACPFSRTRADGEGLPILTVDEEIYRYPPSLLIATVDKLAQLPWYGFAGMLFGRVSRRCPRHGYRHPDLDGRTGCGEKHHATAHLPKTASVPVARLRPPDLIIQDELHLISGALGTTVGLFESAVDELCSWTAPDGGQAGPKTIASTATTKRAAGQVRRLYARELAIFPPQVIDASDTFFSKQVPVAADQPGRRYLGICAHGVRLKSAEIRLAEILLIAGQTLFDQYGEPADPYLTLVGYFNATRELAGMRRYLDDDVATRVRRNGRRKGLSDRLTGIASMLTIRELTSRINSGDIAMVLKELEASFDPERHTSARRIAFAVEARAAAKEKRDLKLPQNFARSAVDVALATSMLQVGVDIARFGLMVVTGQPKNTAEYIQASSRVGRDPNRPGLIVTLYNWSRPRDLAHFEDFEHYHATFYRQVEALSVTPYSRRSLDRGTAATYIAAVRNVVEPHSANAAAYDVDLGGQVVAGVTERMLLRAERAGGKRAREYLAARIDTLKDRWEHAKIGHARLGYQQAKAGGQQLVGLLDPAGDGAWTDLTVGRSMRETENEINLLVPGAGLYDTTYDAPAWSFAPPDSDTDAAADDTDGDELGELSAKEG